MMLRASVPFLVLALAHAGILRAADDTFPPLPDESERSARSEAEIEAGAVVLESVHELSGGVTWKDKVAQGEVIRTHRYRYLVLNSIGSERLSSYPFFRDDPGPDADIRGRTVTAAGTVHPLDPVRDVRPMQIVHPGEEAPHAVRTVSFPHLAPGAILDLAWTQHASEMPGLELVMLQEDLPVRSARVKVQGQLQRGRTTVVPTPFFFYGSWTPGYYWVPFFAGVTPPRATATLDPAFNLDLEVTGIDPVLAEPFSPSLGQAAYIVGLAPRVFSSKKKISRDDWLEHLVLFGTPGMIPLGDGKEAIRRVLDPAASMIRFDDLGFQSLSNQEWSRLGLMETIQDGLKAIHKDIAKHWTLRPTDAPIDRIAPADRPWKERTRRLFEYAREQVAIDAAGKGHETVADLIKDGKGSFLDRTLYLNGLLRSAGIRTRVLRAMSRYGLPFHPVLGQTTPFRPSWLLEVGPAEERPIHVMPGLRYGSFAGLPEAYAGALAFVQPDDAGDDWGLARLPSDVWPDDITEIESRAGYEPDSREITLLVKVTLAGEAAARFRRAFDPLDEPPQDPSEHRKKVLDRWMREWTGARYTGTLPGIAKQSPEDAPLILDLGTPWQPNAESRAEEILLPALPGGGAFRSPFVAGHRSQPMWLVAGRRRISHTWSLPRGAVVPDIPSRAEGSGPGGLAFSFEVTPGGENADPEVTTRLTLDVPTAIAASEYAAVRQFYKDLESAAGTRLCVRRGRPAGEPRPSGRVGAPGR